MQQSDKLKQEEAEKREHYLVREQEEEGEVEQPPEEDDGPVQIRPLLMLNDIIAVLQDQIKTSLELPEGQDGLPTGMVIGIPDEGCGLPDNAGGRLKSQCAIGDRVLFMTRNIIQATKVGPDDPVYAGRTVLYISERSLIQKLTPGLFELVVPD